MNEAERAKLRELATAPLYARGVTVRYTDHHGRLVTGKVLSIEAHWPGYSSAGDVPFLIYTLGHPSYRNGRCTRSDDHILGRARAVLNTIEQGEKAE